MNIEIIGYRVLFAFFKLRLLRLQWVFLLIAALCTNPSALSASPLSVEQTAVEIFNAFTKRSELDEHIAVQSEYGSQVQDFYIALLRPTWGMDVGYAAFATEAARSGPPTAILLENMFTGTRAIIDRSFGIEMQAAAELLFRVRSEQINAASTRHEVLTSLSSVIPAVRLSDALLSQTSTPSTSMLSAVNLQVRLCVLGGDIELVQNIDWLSKLSDVAVTMLDQDQNIVATKKGSMTVHPLDSVLATRDALLKRGIRLQPGDVLAVGTLTDGYSVESLTRLRAVFDGLIEHQSAFVYMGFR